MEREARTKRRLLRRTTRLFGLSGCVTAAMILSVPGVVSGGRYAAVLLLVAMLAIAHIAAEQYDDPRWLALVFVAGVVAVVFVGLSNGGTGSVGQAGAIAAIASLGMGAIAARLVPFRRAWPLLLGAFLLTAVAIVVVTGATNLTIPTIGLTAAVWVTIGAFGRWLDSSVPRLIRRVDNIGSAYNAERLASQAESQRRQDARLLHDTALATLTLLAHSGRGVDATALRSQARNDAHLLRSLRLGEELSPVSSGTYILQRSADFTLDEGIEAVTDRFAGLGLTVNVYGGGQAKLDPRVREAFLLALGECLENVRRHSGVDSADVTVSIDEQTARLLITDTGSGFDPTAVPDGHLGVAESVVARIQEVGGQARVFSAPGAGTTVILEVPQA
ncbi:histidine kinase [Plantibacter sp. VKM Ac-2880]|uniref:sensor histidine kinase n=1 Tax=Plantibacter sp. VKM Ac-2880 TaxID=2783827 RepID=UPI00188F1171|nr:ATP-binding protein [Plantibacter sp. VKM Ac-2880]MBF4569747.1 histidine kinase [Plantibacter sp. VKM Ac-2880]